MIASSISEAFTPPAPYPGTRDLGLLRRLSRNARSQIGSLPQAVYDQASWKPPLPGMPLFVMSSDLVKAVLVDQAKDFTHGELFNRIMRPAWGRGLLLAKGDDWKMQRRAAAQAFRAKGMTDLVPTFVTETQKLMGEWRSRGYGTVDLHKEMKRLTFNIIVETMLSGAEQIDREAFRESVQSFFADISKLRVSYVLRGDAYHGRRSSLTSLHREKIIGYIANLIESRRSTPPRGDIVDLLLAAEDPDTGCPLSDVQLADNLLGFVLAGYETTASALTWTLYLIAAHEPTAARLLVEYESTDQNELTKLTFTQQVISEATRLFPPAFMLTRIAARDVQLGPHKVKAGQRINIPVWAIHRNAQNWPAPHVFDPDRFAPDRTAIGRYAYMPFGAGPRICIGAAFAMTEMTAILSTILPCVKIAAPRRERVWPKTELALVPYRPMLVETAAR